MWYRRKMLLPAVVFTVLCFKVTAVKQLTMAPEAVDDLYTGCNKKALEKVQSGLLRQELNRTEGFQSAWSKVECSQVISGGEQEHTNAILVYANGGKKFRNAFNDAVETTGTNVSTYENNFHYKSLHFLLIDSMKQQDPQDCKNVYFIADNEYTAQKGSKVRFGRFNIAETDWSLVEDVEEGTFFNITTCFFANLKDFCDLHIDYALISPTEEFTVVDVIRHEDYNEIQLNHSKMANSHNCYMISRSPADVSTQWLVLVLASFSLYFFNC